MKSIEMQFAILVGLCVALLASCTGSTDPDPVPTATEVTAQPAVDAPTEVPPTVTPVPVSDEERIAAALAAFEAEPQPPELIAWDLSNPRVDDRGVVLFDVCGWDGQSAFNRDYDAFYDTDAFPDGSITTKRISVAPDSDKCLNSALIESVWDFLNEFGPYYAEVLENPETFETDSRSSAYWFETTYASARPRLAAQAERNAKMVASPFNVEDLPTNSEAPALWRRYVDEDQRLIEVGVCHEMQPAFGEYVDGELVNDFKDGSIEGPHAILVYALIRDLDRESWAVHSVAEGVWGTCELAEDWLPVMNEFRPEAGVWRMVER